MRSLTTSVVIIHPDERKVLCVRHPSLGRWMFPGGRVEENETSDLAACREVREEVGLTVALLDLSPLPQWNRGGNRRLPGPLATIEEQLPESENFYVDVVYVGLTESADIRLVGEVTEASWFDSTEVLQLQTSYPIQEMAADIFSRMDWLRSLPVGNALSKTPV